MPIIKRKMDNYKQRYHFLLSCFSRIYGVHKVDPQMIYFCKEWARSDKEIPRIDLNQLDRFIHEQYESWNRGA